MCDNDEELPRELPSPWVPVARGQFQTNSTVGEVKEKSPVKEEIEAINIDLHSEMENSRQPLGSLQSSSPSAFDPEREALNIAQMLQPDPLEEKERKPDVININLFSGDADKVDSNRTLSTERQHQQMRSPSQFNHEKRPDGIPTTAQGTEKKLAPVNLSRID